MRLAHSWDREKNIPQKTVKNIITFYTGQKRNIVYVNLLNNDKATAIVIITARVQILSRQQSLNSLI